MQKSHNHTHFNQNKARLAMLTSDKVDLESKKVTRVRGGQHMKQSSKKTAIQMFVQYIIVTKYIKKS